MIDEVIPYYKPLGLTPLEAIDRLKEIRPELNEVPITYAGRLDPMAEGLLLLLAGDAVHHKQKYLDLPKIYEAEIILGINTDSYDILGRPEVGVIDKPIDISTIKATLQKLSGTHYYPYPPYSSKTVDGKPLWEWAREGKIDQITIPLRRMNIVESRLQNVDIRQFQEIHEYILSAIKLTTGDFRQEQILKIWDSVKSQVAITSKFQVANIKFEVTSGTYIRTLANIMGTLLGSGATLLKLKRISIGNFQTPL